uniref:PID domain-containing protein n=1 Tax=Myripristis murdjan TaxID=586833 RepID=A0A667XQQ7_9TELE
SCCFLYSPNLLQDMADYIAYVAKDPVNQRACHILECAPGQAGEVINSIGQAFETRFRQLLGHVPPVLPALPSRSLEENAKDHKATEEGGHNDFRDYYNEVPGKTPPLGGIEDMRITQDTNEQNAGIQKMCVSTVCVPFVLYHTVSFFIRESAI